MISIYYQTTFICSYTWSNYRYKWIRGVDRIAKWICLKNLTFPMGIKTFFGNETVDNDQVVVKWFAFLLVFGARNYMYRVYKRPNIIYTFWGALFQNILIYMYIYDVK